MYVSCNIWWTNSVMDILLTFCHDGGATQYSPLKCPVAGIPVHLMPSVSSQYETMKQNNGALGKSAISYLVRLLSHVLSVLRCARMGRAPMSSAIPESVMRSQNWRLREVRLVIRCRAKMPASVTQSQLPRLRSFKLGVASARVDIALSVTSLQPRSERRWSLGCFETRSWSPSSERMQKETFRARSCMEQGTFNTLCASL